MEAFSGFLLGIFATPLALIVLLVLGILFEHNGARGWAVFTALAALTAAYFAFQVPLATLALGAGAYFVIGLVWSFWRYKRHASKVVAENKGADANQKERVLRALHPKAMVSTIVAWILIWPFSIIENLIGDILNVLQLMVTKFFRGVYHRVYDSAVAALQ
jgi:hypothetical protein